MAGRGLIAALCLVLVVACTRSDAAVTRGPVARSDGEAPSKTAAAIVQDAGEDVLLAAGDIASCSSSGDEATADLLDGLAGMVATLGDNVYDNGSSSEFNNCYEPTWGRHKARTMPSAGNHDYNTAGATGYYGYFGAAAGDPAKGYYSYDIGPWHMIVINSNCSSIGGCAAGSDQELWLRDDLAAHSTECTLAYWHHPRFSSGSSHGNSTAMQPIFQALYDRGADVVLSGHEHNYERFAPQTAAGAADAAYGIREFVVGTGGRSHYGFDAAQPNSEVRDGDTYGVLKLTLHASSYDWEFVPVAGETFTDSGSASCHAAPADTDGDGILDANDNCPGDVNPLQQNNDRNFLDLPGKAFDDLSQPHSDALGDVCDVDDDNDGRSDADEADGTGCGGGAVTAELDSDSDGDNYLDGAECVTGSDPLSMASKPTNAQCNTLAGNPVSTDADADGLLAFREVCFYNTDPANGNTDGDACRDGREVASVNANNSVDVIDLLAIAQEAGPYAPPGSPVKVDFDATKNGSIDVLDLAFVASLAGGGGACP